MLSEVVLQMGELVHQTQRSRVRAAIGVYDGHRAREAGRGLQGALSTHRRRDAPRRDPGSALEIFDATASAMAGLAARPDVHELQTSSRATA
jgi:hypothetical protein